MAGHPREGEMSFSEWMRKRWYVLLICAGLAGLATGLMSIIGDLYCYALGTHAGLVGGLLAWAVAYLIYKVDTAGL
jgi:hypothetical protein